MQHKGGLGTWLGLERSFGDIFHKGGKSMLLAWLANQHCFRILER